MVRLKSDYNGHQNDGEVLTTNVCFKDLLQTSGIIDAQILYNVIFMYLINIINGLSAYYKSNPKRMLDHR